MTPSKPVVNRHLRRHVEMERLFGADFLPVSRDALVALLAPPEEKAATDVKKAPELDWSRMKGQG